MKLAQAPGDVESHAPSWRLHVRESDVSRYAGNVRIQRNYKLPR